MRRTRQAAPGKSVPLARFVAAAALLLCVLSGALPAEAVFNPGGPMACCRGMKGMKADGGNSCPLCRRAKAKPRKPVRSEHDACGADLAVRQEKSDAVESHALLLTARADEQVQPEAERGDEASSQDATQSTSRQASVGAASLSRPCPSDCCGTAAGFPNGPRRPRLDAALNEGIRPRPPTAESYTYAPSGLIKATSVLRRSSPPRAPPSALEDRTA